MMFYKQSTRTRVSFEVGIRELGGNPLILDQSTTQIGRVKVSRTQSKYSPDFGWINHPYPWTRTNRRICPVFPMPIVNALTDFLIHVKSLQIV